jgi:hypothetical protein
LTEKPNKLQPALVGGLVAGLLSVVPVISVGCCLWGLTGGAVAAYMLIKRSPVFRVTNGDGAVVGLLAGLIGSVIMMAVNIPVTLSRWPQVIEAIKQQAAKQSDPEAQASVGKFIAFMQDNPGLGAFLIWFIFAIMVACLALLGGIIGVAIFEKRKNQPPQGPQGYPPPPDFAPPGGPAPSNQPPY